MLRYFVIRFSRFNGGGWPPPVTRRWIVAPPPFPNSPWKRRISDETKRAFRSPSFAVSYFHFAIRPFSFFPSRDCTRGGLRKVEEFEKRRNSVSSAHVPGTSFYCGSMNREMKRYTKGKPSTSPLSSLFFCITTIFRTWTSLRIFHLVSGRAKMETILLFVILIISISWKNLGTRL